MIIENFSKWTLGFVSALAAIILSGGIALAQTVSTTPATITPKPSDYAVDVSQGQETLRTDPAAAAQAKEVNDSENDEGDIDNEPAEVAEAVEPEEAEEAAEAEEQAENEEQAESVEGGEASGNNDSESGSNEN